MVGHLLECSSNLKQNNNNNKKNLHFLLSKKFLFLFDNKTGETQKDLPSADSFSKWPQWSWALPKAKSLELLLDLLHADRSPRNITCCFPRCKSKALHQNWTAGTSLITYWMLVLPCRLNRLWPACQHRSSNY